MNEFPQLTDEQLAGVEPEPAWRRRKCMNADGSRKLAYDGRNAARRFAQRTNRDGNGGGGQPVREYHCNRCGKWHVGHAGFAADDEWAERERRRLARRRQQ